MELKNVNSDNDNVVARNLIKSTFVFETLEIWIKKQRSCVSFSKKCNDCPKSKIPHIVHLRNQHWINQSSPCKYGYIPQEQIKLKNWKFF